MNQPNVKLAAVLFAASALAGCVMPAQNSGFNQASAKVGPSDVDAGVRAMNKC